MHNAKHEMIILKTFNRDRMAFDFHLDIRYEWLLNVKCAQPVYNSVTSTKVLDDRVNLLIKHTYV